MIFARNAMRNCVFKNKLDMITMKVTQNRVEKVGIIAERSGEQY